MSAAIGEGEVERFRVAVGELLGLNFDDTKLGLLGDVLRRRLQATSAKSDAYLSEVFSSDRELAALARELTIPETYFFRNMEQFQALAEAVVSDLIRREGSRRELRVLSAGCASGEEPYSIAMLMRSVLPGPSWHTSIRAIDINPIVLAKARAGCYSSWALRETPDDMRRRWFRREGRGFVLDEAVRETVTFEQHNLTDEAAEVWLPETYEIIFCRNVLMYLTPAWSQSVVRRIARALVAGGYLFLGHAETLRGVSNAFHLCHTHGTFYYQRKESLSDIPTRLSKNQCRLATPGTQADAAPASTGWSETILRAGERIHTLATAQPDRPAPVRAGHWDIESDPEVQRVLALLRQERFAEALEMVLTLLSACPGHPDLLVLQAVLLTNTGRFSEAEEVCHLVLATGHPNAAANYLLAVCADGTGDRLAAIEHDQAAVCADGAFAMPRLHLGLLARRTGDRETASRELREAMALLQTEEGSRLMLFGGGFAREALIALCRSELIAMGAAR